MTAEIACGAQIDGKNARLLGILELVVQRACLLVESNAPEINLLSSLLHVQVAPCCCAVHVSLILLSSLFHVQVAPLLLCRPRGAHPLVHVTGPARPRRDLRDATQAVASRRARAVRRRGRDDQAAARARGVNACAVND